MEALDCGRPLGELGALPARMPPLEAPRGKENGRFSPLAFGGKAGRIAHIFMGRKFFHGNAGSRQGHGTAASLADVWEWDLTRRQLPGRRRS